MSTTTTYSGTLNAFITNQYTTPETLKASDNPVHQLFYSAHDHKETEGWVRVGTAKILVTMEDEQTIVAGMVEAIDVQIQDTYAEAESKINLLKQKKQELLAITLDVS